MRRKPGLVGVRKKAMQAIVGLWKHRRDIANSTAYVRGLRQSMQKRTALPEVACLEDAQYTDIRVVKVIQGDG
jgi:hypothetical protein